MLASAQATVTPAGAISTAFGGGGWWRTWASSSLTTAPVALFPFNVTQTTVGIRFNLTAAPGTNVTLWSWPASISIKLTLDGSGTILQLVAGLSPTTMKTATVNARSLGVAIGIPIRVQVTITVNGVVMYVESDASALLSTRLAIDLTAAGVAPTAQLTMPPAIGSKGSALVTELYVTTLPYPVVFVYAPPPAPPAPPFTPPTPLAPSPSPPPAAPMPAFPPALVSHPLAQANGPSGIQHGWLPAPVVTSWEAIGTGRFNGTLRDIVAAPPDRALLVVQTGKRYEGAVRKVF